MTNLLSGAQYQPFAIGSEDTDQWIVGQRTQDRVTVYDALGSLVTITTGLQPTAYGRSAGFADFRLSRLTPSASARAWEGV